MHCILPITTRIIFLYLSFSLLKNISLYATALGSSKLLFWKCYNLSSNLYPATASSPPSKLLWTYCSGLTAVLPLSTNYSMYSCFLYPWCSSFSLFQGPFTPTCPSNSRLLQSQACVYTFHKRLTLCLTPWNYQSSACSFDVAYLTIEA